MPQQGIHPLDALIFVGYFLGILGVGAWYYRRNKGLEDYFVGGRGMSASHIGLSVVATDVGGGFSIGLGGLGFTMGLSGSWLLFTGLIGAWLSAVLLIPRVFDRARAERWTTFPQLFRHAFSAKVALLAGVVSAIGYLGFTASQLLAGAKLASATFEALDMGTALWVMGGIAVVYTVAGGLKAVIYTDTIQWIILLAGLILVGLPFAYQAVGGMPAIRESVPPEMLRLDNVDGVTLLNWAVTVIPIWFVGMTLYQRIYACRDQQTAKRAWYIAGVFEYPIMAFLGVGLGLLSRVALDQGLLGPETAATLDPEQGLPLLLRTVLPVGFLGLVLSAYFSAILSTADSCLMAASGNVVSDLMGRGSHHDAAQTLRLSQIATAIIGLVALLLASAMTDVLKLMLLSYGFMVSGLLVPVLAALFLKRPKPRAAFWAIWAGGLSNLACTLAVQGWWPIEVLNQALLLPYGLDPNLVGLSASALVFGLMQGAGPDQHSPALR
jgi:SSS family solute:Na+ symporter